MKKWILVIGFLTYSSVGWSKELIMECFYDYGQSNGIYRLDTNEPDTSEELLMMRQDGKWVGFICDIDEDNGCKKGDDSVVTRMIQTPYGSDEKQRSKTVYDFKFLRVTFTYTTLDGKFIRESTQRCEKR